MEDKIKCKICGLEFTARGLGRHIMRHQISIKDYYDKYIKKEGEGICRNPICNNKTKFAGLKGYQKHCCLLCANKNPETSSNIKKTCLDKYGVDNPMKNKKIKDKCGDSLKKTFQDDNKKKRISLKREKTIQEKYGVLNVISIPGVKEKIKKTNLEKYGVEFSSQNPDFQKKIRETSKEKYGVDHFLSSKVIIDKRKENNLEKYGVECVLQRLDIKEKIKQTNLKKYGVKHNSQDPEIRKKMVKSHKETIEKNGEEINEKRRLTNIERRNVDYPTQDIEVKKKSRNTSLKTFKKKVLNSISKLGISLIDENELNYTSDLVHLKCNVCGREFTNRWYNIQLGYGKCPRCFPRNSPSHNEIENADFIKSLGLNVEIGDYSLIKPYQLDLIVYEKKIAIEHNGLYWHRLKDKDYHLNKTILCEKKGYRLIHIFEDEWMFKKEIVKHILKNILHKNDSIRIHGRKCEVKEINSKEKNEFLNKYHILGEDKSVIKLGAFFDKELVSVMTFSHGSISRGKTKSDLDWELSRFCSDYNYRIPGIAGKLLEHFKRNYNWKEIYSYADRRWSEGDLYKKLGFEFVHQTPPDYWYLGKDMIRRIHRFALRKRLDEPKDKTEWELRLEEGYSKIFDCGKIKFKITKE